VEPVKTVVHITHDHIALVALLDRLPIGFRRNQHGFIQPPDFGERSYGARYTIRLVFDRCAVFP
jgi:hypothetical protein